MKSIWQAGDDLRKSPEAGDFRAHLENNGDRSCLAGL